MGTLLGFENKIQAKNREAKHRSSAGDGVRLERRARRELLLRLGTWTRREGDGPRRPVHEGGRAVDTDLQVGLRLRIGGVAHDRGGRGGPAVRDSSLRPDAGGHHRRRILVSRKGV